MDRNDRALTAFTMIGHATFHTYELVLPIFVVVWLDEFGTTAAVLGVVVGASYALTGVGALPSGLLADRVGSRRLVLLSLLGMGLAFLAVGAAPTLPVLAGALLLWGGAASLYHPAGLALISRGAKRRGTAFAYHGVAGNLGVAVGPLAAVVLLSAVHWRVVAAALVVPVAIGLVVGSRLEFDESAGARDRASRLEFDESAGTRSHAESATGADDGEGQPTAQDGSPTSIRSLGSFLDSTKLLFAGGFAVVFVISALNGIYYRGTLTFLPDLLADLPLFEPVAVGGRDVDPSRYVYTGLLLLGGVGQYAGGRLVERVPGEYALVGAYVLLTALALVFVPATEAGLWPLLFVAAALGVALFGVAPINQEVISRYTAPEVRGLSFGYVYTAVFGVGALGATLAGTVLTYATSTTLFLVLAGTAATAGVLGLLLVGRS